jgi:hypothetical protein
MEPHQERVIKEKEALQPMVSKLHNFVNGASFDSVSPEEQQLLKRQLSHMQAYLDTLNDRIKLWQDA